MVAPLSARKEAVQLEGGFTFAGIDIADLGLEYAPELQNTYVYAPSSFEVSDETFPAHDGGYFYGTTVRPKDFTLRCIFEYQHLNSGKLTRIYDAFKRGTTGRLVFKKRPWCWYVATVVKEPQLQPTNYLNGLITFTVRAYYPFARSDQTAILDNDPNEEDIKNNSAMLKGVEWDTSKDFGPMDTQKEIYIYNPGTETAATSIEISGNVGSGITIYNETTKQRCDIVGFNSDDTLSIDSLNGKVLTINGNNVNYGFLYHDNGFIDLASNYPIVREVHLTATNGSNQFIVEDEDVFLSKSLIGQHIGFYLNGSSAFLGQGVIGQMILNNVATDESFYIATVTNISDDGKTITTNVNIEMDDDPETVEPMETKTVLATITTFNKIVITPKDSMNLTNFVVKYKPTFA